MQRRRGFVTGLVVAVIAGGILGALVVAAGIGLLPDPWVGAGTALAAGVGYLVARWFGRPTQPDPGVVPAAAERAPAEPATPARAAWSTAAPSQTQMPAPAAEPTDADLTDASPGGSGLPPSLIRLSGRATGRVAAIEEAGELLVAAGVVDPAYVAAMQAREEWVSTHMGNLLAVPHGNHQARHLVRRSALALVRYPDTIDWHGNRVRFVVATAALDDADQVRLVSQVAGVFLDEDAVARLEAAETPQAAAAAFAAAAG